MFLENLGKKFVRGAKAEIAAPVQTPETWDRILDAVVSALEVGVFIYAMFSGKNVAASNQPQTIIINNYIQGGWKDE